MPAPMARWSRRRLPPAPAGASLPGLRRATPTPEQRTAFERAARSGVVVVQSSRASGRVAPRRRLRESGIVAGEDLSPQKARILLMLALLTPSNIAAIQEVYRIF